MDEINGSVNVSEILGTLTQSQKDILNKQALRIIKNEAKSNLTEYMAFIDMCRDELTPIQRSAVKALLDEIRKRREELLNQLMKAVEDAMLYGTGGEGVKIKETWKAELDKAKNDVRYYGNRLKDPEYDTEKRNGAE